MANLSIPVKDSAGTSQGIAYDNTLGASLLQPVNVVTQITTGVTPGVAAAQLGKAEDAVHASGDTGVMMLCVRTDTPATISSATGDYEPPKVNEVGALWITPTPAPKGGATITRVMSAASTNATLIKSTAGNLLGIWASNTGASVRYLKIYNLATAPTVGTSTPQITIALPAGFCGDLNIGTYGITFAAGISIAITGAYADSDTTAVGAGEVMANILYK